MTELQIKAQALEEEKRHNRATEQVQHAQNAITQAHYQTSDAYTAQHYQISDESGRISANANAMNALSNAKNAETNAQNAITNAQNATTNAMNAQTQRMSYQMTHDIEYGWSGDSVYPKGMPLSAQEKSSKIQSTIMETEADVALKEAQRANQQAGVAGTIVNAIFGKTGILGAFNSFD